MQTALIGRARRAIKLKSGVRRPDDCLATYERMGSMNKTAEKMANGQGRSNDVMAIAITEQEVATMFHISRDSVRKLVRQGVFPKPVEFGRSRRYSVEKLKEWFLRQCGQ
jgi:predicted DNA-binding transcriptional regulator AlpA